jgi:hypothetical protein
MMPRFHLRTRVPVSPKTIAILCLFPAASYAYAVQPWVPVPPGLTIPQSGTFVAPSGNQYTFSGTHIIVANAAAGMKSAFRTEGGKVILMIGGMDTNRMLAELEAHQAASVAPVAATLTQSAPTTPHVTPGTDGSYSVALSDGSTVTFLNKGTRVEVADPALTMKYALPVKMIALQYVTASKSIARSLLAFGHGSDGAAASPAGTWESADVDPRAGGFSEEAGLVHSRLVPVYIHTIAGEILDAMKLAEATEYKVIGESAMKNLYLSPYVGGRSGGRVYDQPH